MTLRIEYLPIEKLAANNENARVHSNDQISQIELSIKTFGFCVPVLIDKFNKIICGHGRYCASQKLKLKEIPIIKLEHLNESQIKAFSLADNRLVENSTWNEEILALTLKDLSVLDLDFSIEATGFLMAEIDLKIANLDFNHDEREASDDIGEFSSLKAVTKPNDIWKLGNHTIHCGNALELASYKAVLGNSLADIIFTDPPYNVPIQGHVSGKGKIKHREFDMATGEMSEENFTGFLSNCFRILKERSKAGSIHYICMDWRHILEIGLAGKKNYSELKNICVWNKGNGGMGSFYRSQHELVFVYKNGKERHRNNIQLGKFGRNRTNVWDYPGMNGFPQKGDEKGLLALHPTVKPVKLIEDVLLDSTLRNEIVLDCFLGSGSTLIAAEKCGRRCAGIELDPLYVDTAIRRWQGLTGLKAVQIRTGKSFDELSISAECNDVRR